VHLCQGPSSLLEASRPCGLARLRQLRMRLRRRLATPVVHDGGGRLGQGVSAAAGVGRTHAGTHVLLLARDLEIRIINAATGELLRQLTLDPARNYQPTGRPPGPTKTTPRKRSNPEP
jgi:hypothetical protein